MISLEEETIELKRYLKKLQYVIEQETKFTLINARIVDKKKVDDILCCIESSFPETYKNFIKEKGPYKLKSSKSHILLNEAIKNKFLFSTNVYSVMYADAIQAIKVISNSIDTDIRLILSGDADKI